MASGTYSPERDITSGYLATVSDWIIASGEVLVIMRYLYGAGAKHYALIESVDVFQRLVDLCPDGTDIIVCRDPQLPYRGLVDAKFIGEVSSALKGAGEYMLVNLSPEGENDPRCNGQFDYVSYLTEELEEELGENVAVGKCPDFMGPDNEAMISASKGGIDGPR